jgi:hypothetical protein
MRLLRISSLVMRNPLAVHLETEETDETKGANGGGKKFKSGIL